MDDTKILKNPRIVFLDDMYGFTSKFVKESKRDLTERDFKKWYNRIYKKNKYIEGLTILAEYEDEDGIHDISSYWACVEMDKNPRLF